MADNGLAGNCHQDECVRIRNEVGAPVRTVRFRPRRIAQVLACCTVLFEQRCAGRGEASDVADSRLPDLDLVHLANDKPGDSPSNAVHHAVPDVDRPQDKIVGPGPDVAAP